MKTKYKCPVCGSEVLTCHNEIDYNHAHCNWCQWSLNGYDDEAQLLEHLELICEEGEK